MQVKELLDRLQITQHELSEFTGIQRATIGKWISENRTPPKVTDLNKLIVTENYFTGKSQEEIKNAIKTHRVFNDTVRSILEIQEINGNEVINGSFPKSKYLENKNTSIVNEPPISETGTNFADDYRTKTHTSMEHRLLALLEKKESQIDQLITNNTKLVDSQLELVSIISRLSPKPYQDNLPHPKSKAS